MHGDLRFAEDLPQLAADACVLANRLCGSCRNFHGLWPYRRLTRMVGAAEAGGPALASALAELFDAGRRSVLIAGAADTGVLAMTARAGARHHPEFLIIDICETPLVLCRRFAERWSLPVETACQDLTTLNIADRFDIVIAHSLLQFIAADRRVDFLSRVNRVLRRDGRLALVFNSGNRIGGDAAVDYRRSYSSWVIERLRSAGVPLPEPESEFRARLDAHAQNRESREGAFADPGEVDAMLNRAGFAIIKRTEIDMPLAAPYEHFVSQLSKRRFLTIAGPE